ncbi:ankyrin repeat-containing domain protein [Chytridium lagenaria]|nr:ankyrin repeat-containing domain protein [Chytridium lagenaria]
MPVADPQTNIWLAASDGDLAVVQQFLMAGQHPNVKDENGYTPIHAAASYGHLELLEYLLQNGGDPNIGDNEGDTPLHFTETPIYLCAFTPEYSTNKENELDDLVHVQQAEDGEAILSVNLSRLQEMAQSGLLDNIADQMEQDDMEMEGA